jgi:two-component system sensor histidine kinase/response regulator
MNDGGTSLGGRASNTSLAARVRGVLPKGGTLPDDVWRSRHHGILVLLWLHVPGLFLFALARGEHLLHALLEAGIVASPALAAQLSAGRRRVSTIFAAIGLMTASATLVHLSGGMIEAHFHFFVMVGIVVLYQDWLPFLIAIGFVVLHHGTMGVLSPEDVYNHEGAWAQPWIWAGVHGAGILAMSVAGIANWKLNERSQSQLSRLAAIVASSEDAIYGWTLDREINDWNGGAAQLFGYTAEEVIGRPFNLLVPPDQLAEVSARWDDLVHGRRVDSFDTVRVRKDGSLVDVSVTVSAVRSVQGVVIGGATIARDIADRKRSERELQQARDKALESAKLKSEFLATMSHEIRTPMNGVIGLTGLLLDSGLTETQHQYADGVRASGEALLGIINDILDFSKIEAGKLELEIVDFDLADAIDDVATLVAESARMKGLELVAFCSPQVPHMLRGDVGRLRQILLNLASNAVKFTGEGEVVIRAGLGTPAGDGRVGVRMEVVDTGIGVATATAERLFEPFSQADASTTRRYGGTGLGLAICRQLAEAMGGTIGVNSEPGHGSTFWLDVPFARAVDAPARPAVKRALAPGMRVLVVDDNDTNRLVLGAQLLAWDIAADVAPDGFVALDLLRHAAATGRPYDLALVDMAMPGMDGLELARTITSEQELRSVRLLLLSSLIVDSEEAARAGFAVRLTKPARLSQLHDAILRAMAPPQVAAPAPAPRRASGPSATLGRLLIVEDNAINQAVAKGMAAKLGYDCDVAGNGIEAIQALGRRQYDAVLMDCQMPEMDGFEATGEIRRGPAPTNGVPIVAMTASALVEDRDRCLDAGMDDYLPKPIRAGDLDKVLRRLLPVIYREHRDHAVLQETSGC